ncbi:MAG: tetratricopeptide repeat protein [Burkholderiales bacterium]|nr:tetratricopeptide repeat protein [Burkholderiales bacterium]
MGAAPARRVGQRARAGATEANIKRIVTPLLLLCALAGGAVVPARAEMSRDQAVAALRSDAPGERSAAVERLARSGTMADVEALLDALRDEDAHVRSLAEGAIWSIWLRSGDADTDALVRKGVAHMEARQMGAALDAFTRAIERRPDFAEAWNKRATAYFLIGDFDQSLHDCEKALERNPNHFGALAGCAGIYAHRDQLEHALDYLERAFELNPNLEGVEIGLTLVRHRLGRTGRQEI